VELRHKQMLAASRAGMLRHFRCASSNPRRIRLSFFWPAMSKWSVAECVEWRGILNQNANRLE